VTKSDRLVRLPEVMHRTGLSRATIYRKASRGEFPHQIQLSANVVAWYESDVDQWMSNPMTWCPGAQAA
jgi:prophage regulatory protein